MPRLYLNVLKDVKVRLDALIRDCDAKGIEYIDAHSSRSGLQLPLIEMNVGYVELYPADSYNRKDDLLETFLEYHENPDYRFDETVFDKVYAVLDQYVDLYENPDNIAVDVLFNRMPISDQRKVIRYFESAL